MAIYRLFNLSNLTLFTALALSSIAAWYSILGLIAIFAAAVLPITIMGSVLEFAKVVTTVWLHRYWHKASWILKLYLVPAVLALAFLTSMGIFGFLSKTHIEQGTPSGEVMAKMSLIDEKIKTQRENIELARKALTQMDNQVDQRLSRGTTEQGVDKAVAIRKQQAKERATLQNDIGTAQKEIAKLNDERAPIASQLRTAEAEVGPIRYIAAFIYGDNPDQNILERAVRWVIVLIVLVFDPLALVLVISSNSSREWDKEIANEAKSIGLAEEVEEKPISTEEKLDNTVNITDNVKVSTSIDDIPQSTVLEAYISPDKWEKYFPNKNLIEPEVADPEVIEPEVADPEVIEPEVADPEVIEPEVADPEVIEPEKIPVSTIEEGHTAPLPPNLSTADQLTNITPIDIITEGVTREREYTDQGDGYVTFEGKQVSKQALKEMKPELFVITADATTHLNTSFGTSFPRLANKGDLFVRVDALPNKVYKFNGVKWIEVNKELSSSYLHDQEYIKHLITKIDSGEYDLDLISDHEKDQIKRYLDNQNS